MKINKRECHYCKQEITEGQFFYDLKYKTMENGEPKRVNDNLIIAVHTGCFHSVLHKERGKA
jgi:hypothetical protein